MKAILIDAQNETVTEVEYDGKLKSAYKMIGCDIVEAVYPFGNTDAIFVDEEGLLKTPAKFFTVANYPQPLAGNGLVIGINGDDVETTLTKVQESVKFFTLAQAQAMYRH